MEPRSPSFDDRLVGFNKSYAVVRWGSHTLIMSESFPDGERRKLTFAGKEGFLLWVANQIHWKKSEEGKNIKVKLGPAWLEWEQRRQYEAIIFEPNAHFEPNVYNLWVGFSHIPDPLAGKFDIFLDHLRTNICSENEEHYQWLLGWIADLFQRPDRKIGTAVVLRGKMGVGKGVVAKHIGALVHRHYFTVTKAEQVTGKFNGHLTDKLLVLLDEAFWGGNKEAEGTLRALVTETDMPIEMKGKDLYSIRSYLRLILSTNNDWAVPTGMRDERRFAIFDVGDRCQQNKPYFSEMESQLQNGGYKALLHYFLNFKYDPNKISEIPMTAALLDQKLLSMPHEFKWWYNCLCDGKIGDKNWGETISRTDFYSAYITFCNQVKVRHPLDKKWLTRSLQRKADFKEKNDKKTFDGWEYQLFDIDIARMHFENMLGHTLQWDGEEL